MTESLKLPKAIISCREISVEIPIYTSANRSFRHTILKKMVGGTLAANNGIVSVRALHSVSFEAYLGDSIGMHQNL